MAARAQRPKLLVIVGPTASGKSGLALKVAKKFNGEIICADSRTVYQDMNIGTAKPSPKDTKLVPHWGLDLVKPGQRFTAAQFKEYAKDKISDIQCRDKLPIVVGGTGLYIDSLLFDFSFDDDVDYKKRQKLEGLNIDQLQTIIKQKKITMPENSQNRRYLIRAIEKNGRSAVKKNQIFDGAIIVGLLPKDKELRRRINSRAENMFKVGIIDETRKLIKKYGKAKILKTAGIAYKICIGFLNGEYDEAKAVELSRVAEWHYARRQKTWFKRNKDIIWFSSANQALNYLVSYLNT